jgi:hypothetical protein
MIALALVLLLGAPLVPPPGAETPAPKALRAKQSRAGRAPRKPRREVARGPAVLAAPGIFHSDLRVLDPEPQDGGRPFQPLMHQLAVHIELDPVPAMPAGMQVALAAAPAVARSSTRGGLDFDLLGGGGNPVDLGANEPSEPIYRRRWMLTLHQVSGYGLLGLMSATMITGQLNYSDKFNGPATNRYAGAHSVLAGTTVGVFAATGLLAALAPNPFDRDSSGIDRVTIHKIGMIGATGGMVAQAVLGIYTASREGYANQSGLAAIHLGIGYATLAFMAAGVGAIVF